MAVTSNLKSKVDLPVWEWCRPLPASSTSTSCTCHSSDDRYIYYLVGSTFYRYDTITDSWNQLATPLVTPSGLIEMKYSTAHGHYGRAISNGGSANTIELAGLQGNVFVGKKIRIISGKGAGQERTITAVSDPIIQDRGVVTTASSTQIVDASTGVMIKQWKLNQWRDYQIRLLYGGNANNVVRPVLWNNGNTLAVSDTSWASITPWWGPQLLSNTNATAGSQTLYQIESNIVTVDSNWTVQPDSTSNFVIMSDGIWMITSNGSAPFYSFLYYDVAADMWYFKTNTGNIFPSALGTDICIETIQESSPVISGVVTSANSGILTDSSLNLTPTTYANYELRITSGSGIGQSRNILSNTSGSFFPVRNFDIIPASGDIYGIYKDVGKIYIAGGNTSVIAQYEVESDLAFCGKRFDWGVARTATVTASGQDMVPIAISAITYVIQGVTALDPIPSTPGTGYLSGQILNITAGGAGAMARILGVDINGGVTQVGLESNGSSYTLGTGKSTTVNPLGGAGCTLNITGTGNIGLIVTTSPHNFKIGDTINITGITPSEYNGQKTIIGTNTITSTDQTRLTYAVNNINPTIVNTQSATTLYDISKNWITNEHVGKLVLITTAASTNATAVIRRITANTSNTLSFATITTAATNGTHRYAIISDKAFATDESIGSVLAAPAYSGRGRGGVATGGTTTSLTDSSKNWPINYWSNTNPAGASNTGRKVRIIKGTGAGNEMIILSNTATTLTFAAQSFTPDSTSVYLILDNFGIVTTGGVSTITDNTQNWGTNIWSGKRVRITGGTGVGNESVINSNTQTTLTLATALNADTTSTYAILAPNNRSTGIAMFHIKNSSNSNLNNKYIYIFRGGGTNEIIRYNIVTEEIDNITYFPFTDTFTTGSMYIYDGEDRIYIQKDATGRIMYYDIVKNIVVNSSTIPYGMSTAIIGNRMEITKTSDGLKYLYVVRHSSQEFWRSLIYW